MRVKEDYSIGFFAYGGMKDSQRNTKIHICNSDAEPLCGVKSDWMQVYEKLNEVGIIKDYAHVFKTHYDQNTCLKCLKKFKLLNTISDEQR